VERTTPMTRNRQRSFQLKKTNLRYPAFGHGAGDVIWWVGNDGKVKMFVSTGHEMHHDLNRRMDMDARWRGRLELSTGIVTMQPPLKQLSSEPHRDMVSVPTHLLRVLRRMGGVQFFVALLDGRLHLVCKRALHRGCACQPAEPCPSVAW